MTAARRTVQIGYVVSDLERACERFHDAFGIGPFLMIPPRPRPNVRHHGAPLDGELVTAAALAQSGDVMIELLCQHSQVPSAYRDMFAPGEQGLHHVAFWTEDYRADCLAYEASGFPIAMEMEFREGLHVAYVDTRAELGHMVELLPRHPSITAVFETVREAAAAWDGTDLLRPLR